MNFHPISDCKMYVLESVNILRKYTMLLDLPISLLSASYWYLVSFEQRRNIRVSICCRMARSARSCNVWIIILFKFCQQMAMKAHKSQYVWFRKLYMGFSRYTFINTLQEISTLDLELDLEIDDEWIFIVRMKKKYLYESKLDIVNRKYNFFNIYGLSITHTLHLIDTNQIRKRTLCECDLINSWRYKTLWYTLL